MQLPASGCQGWRAAAVTAAAPAATANDSSQQQPVVCRLVCNSSDTQYLWAEEVMYVWEFSSVPSLAAHLCAGVVKSTKMTRTIVVRRDYLHYIKKYARCEHGHTSDTLMRNSAQTAGVSVNSRGSVGGHPSAAHVALTRR
jgi:hypothetical protein